MGGLGLGLGKYDEPDIKTNGSLCNVLTNKVKSCVCVCVCVCVEPPQFNLTLLEEDDDPSDPELTCSFLLALMQKHTRQRGTLFPVGLHIYKVTREVYTDPQASCNPIGRLKAIPTRLYINPPGNLMFTGSQTAINILEKELFTLLYDIGYNILHHQSRLHLFDQKYSKTVKYYYYLK